MIFLIQMYMKKKQNLEINLEINLTNVTKKDEIIFDNLKTEKIGNETILDNATLKELTKINFSNITFDFPDSDSDDEVFNDYETEPMQKLETKAKKEELNYEKLVVHEEHFEKILQEEDIFINKYKIEYEKKVKFI